MVYAYQFNPLRFLIFTYALDALLFIPSHQLIYLVDLMPTFFAETYFEDIMEKLLVISNYLIFKINIL